MKKIVGVGDLKISSNINDTIITHALGSCLGITAYDPIYKIGGMVHVMLPLSKADPEKAKAKPAMYVDTGFSLLPRYNTAPILYRNMVSIFDALS